MIVEKQPISSSSDVDTTSTSTSTIRRKQQNVVSSENGVRRRTSQPSVSDLPQKVTNHAAAAPQQPQQQPTAYSYGTYRSSQYPQREKLLNYHPLFHSPVINNKTTVDHYSNYYYGSRLADMSQGSCDNTPATPDSLDSLVISDELCQSPPSVSSDLPPPPTTELGKPHLCLI